MQFSGYPTVDSCSLHMSQQNSYYYYPFESHQTPNNYFAVLPFTSTPYEQHFSFDPKCFSYATSVPPTSTINDPQIFRSAAHCQSFYNGFNPSGATFPEDNPIYQMNRQPQRRIHSSNSFNLMTNSTSSARSSAYQQTQNFFSLGKSPLSDALPSGGYKLTHSQSAQDAASLTANKFHLTLQRGNLNQVPLPISKSRNSSAKTLQRNTSASRLFKDTPRAASLNRNPASSTPMNIQNHKNHDLKPIDTPGNPTIFASSSSSPSPASIVAARFYANGEIASAAVGISHFQLTSNLSPNETVSIDKHLAPSPTLHPHNLVYPNEIKSFSCSTNLFPPPLPPRGSHRNIQACLEEQQQHPKKETDCLQIRPSTLLPKTDAKLACNYSPLNVLNVPSLSPSNSGSQSSPANDFGNIENAPKLPPRRPSSSKLQELTKSKGFSSNGNSPLAENQSIKLMVVNGSVSDFPPNVPMSEDNRDETESNYQLKQNSEPEEKNEKVSKSITRQRNVIKRVHPAVYRRFMEQRVANLGRIHKERDDRLERLEFEMAKVGLDQAARQQMRILLRKKESNYMRMQRTKMDQTMFNRIKRLG